MTTTMYDSVTPANIPSTAPAVALYVDGLFVWPPDQVARFAAVPEKTITVVATNYTADILDVEPGNPNATEGAAWAKQVLANGKTPTIYCSKDENPGYGWPDVQAALTAAGVAIADVDFWIADWTGAAHLVPGSVATQWSNVGGFDTSLATLAWLNLAGPTSVTQAFIAAVTSQLGVPYVFGGETPRGTPGDPQGGFDCCLTADSLVITPEGAISIRDARPGTTVLSYVDTDSPRLVWDRVVAWHEHGVRPVLQIRSRNRSVVATGNHPFLIARRSEPRWGGQTKVDWWTEWVRADELKRGDLLVTMEQEPADIGTDQMMGRRVLTPELALILGRWVGNGWVAQKRGGIRISCYDEKRDRLAKVIEQELGLAVRRNNASGIMFTDGDLWQALKAEGFDHPSPEKLIPPIVWRSSAKVRRAFLEGYEAADGYFSEARQERTFSSASRLLVDQVRMMHVLLGDRISNTTVNNRDHEITIKGKVVKNALPLYTAAHYLPRAGTARRGRVALDIHGFRRLLPDDYLSGQAIAEIRPMADAVTYDIQTTLGAFVTDGVVVHNSGLMQYGARQAGVTIPRTSEEQFAALPLVTDPQAGDLVFFNVPGDSQPAPGHVGMCTNTGCTEQIDAPHTGAVVRYDPTAGYGTIMGYGRLPGSGPPPVGSPGVWSVGSA